MQNKYVGDIGDFGKYLLLKWVSKGFRLGVNWCLVPDEAHKSDGKFTQYLEEGNESEYYRLDATLYKKLREIVESKKRSVNQIQRKEVLEHSTMFFSEHRRHPFRDWHERSIKHLKDSEVIFYDPDNGLETKSAKNLNKYITYEEVGDAYRQKKSVIVYQHTNRNGKVEDQIRRRCGEVIKGINIPEKNMFVARFCRTQSRYYLILAQEEHFSRIKENIEKFKNMLSENKSNMFLLYQYDNDGVKLT